MVGRGDQGRNMITGSDNLLHFTTVFNSCLLRRIVSPWRAGELSLNLLNSQSVIFPKPYVQVLVKEMKDMTSLLFFLL